MHVHIGTCVCAYFSMSDSHLPFPSQQKKQKKHAHTPLLPFILQNPTARYYCHANLRRLSPQMQSYLFIQTRAWLTLGTSKKSGSRRESRHKRPQTPQMGFQSVLIYLSPWGLLSVVICLCLGWHHPCPSCFRLCIPCMRDNPQLHQRTHLASRTACGNENRERAL